MLVSNSAAAVAEQAVSGYCCQPKTNAGQLSQHGEDIIVVGLSSSKSTGQSQLREDEPATFTMASEAGNDGSAATAYLQTWETASNAATHGATATTTTTNKNPFKRCSAIYRYRQAGVQILVRRLHHQNTLNAAIVIRAIFDRPLGVCAIYRAC